MLSLTDRTPLSLLICVQLMFAFIVLLDFMVVHSMPRQRPQGGSGGNNSEAISETAEVAAQYDPLYADHMDYEDLVGGRRLHVDQLRPATVFYVFIIIELFIFSHIFLLVCWNRLSPAAAVDRPLLLIPGVHLILALLFAASLLAVTGTDPRLDYHGTHNYVADKGWNSALMISCPLLVVTLSTVLFAIQSLMLGRDCGETFEDHWPEAAALIATVLTGDLVVLHGLVSSMWLLLGSVAAGVILDLIIAAGDLWHHSEFRRNRERIPGLSVIATNPIVTAVNEYAPSPTQNPSLLTDPRKNLNNQPRYMPTDRDQPHGQADDHNNDHDDDTRL